MSSSEEERDHKQSGKNYTIDLQAFSKSRIRLETELRNNSAAIEILDTYCTEGVKFDEVNPFLNPDGANPLLTDLYVHDPSGDISAPWGSCAYTEEGKQFRTEMDGDGAAHAREGMYGDEITRIPLPTPGNIHRWPAKAWRHLNAYYIQQNSTAVYTKSNWKALNKRVKKWLRNSHRIWSKIVGRLPNAGIHLTGGLEMSNGTHLYNNLLFRYGHTHAQCLAQLLCILADIELLKPDPTTRELETIQDYFDRCQRIAREAREFPAMKFPIAGPLLKVMILQGLIRSDKDKYHTMVINAYANDLKDPIDRLQTTFETVEGLRTKQITDEYAPTSLSEGTVAFGDSESDPRHPSNHPDQPCEMEGHMGHTKSQCISKWGESAVGYRGGRGRGRGRSGGRGHGSGRGRGKRASKGTMEYKGVKGLCRYYTTGRTCPYGASCNFEHKKDVAKAYYMDNTFEPAAAGRTGSMNVSRATTDPFDYIVDHTDTESSGDSTDSGNE
jgi:hypothetical protein